MHSGLIHKFLAFEEMLRIKPEWRDKVVLIQICFIKDDGNADLVSRLHRLVARINGRNTTVAGRSGGPVYLIERHASKKGTAMRNQKEKTFALVTESSPYFDDSSILSPYLGSGNSAFFKKNKEQFQNVGPTPTVVNSSKVLRADTDQDVSVVLCAAVPAEELTPAHLGLRYHGSRGRASRDCDPVGNEYHALSLYCLQDGDTFNSDIDPLRVRRCCALTWRRCDFGEPMGHCGYGRSDNSSRDTAFEGA